MNLVSLSVISWQLVWQQKITNISYQSVLTFVSGAQKNVLLSTHNTCFVWEISELIFNYTLLTKGLERVKILPFFQWAPRCLLQFSCTLWRGQQGWFEWQPDQWLHISEISVSGHSVSQFVSSYTRISPRESSKESHFNCQNRPDSGKLFQVSNF